MAQRLVPAEYNWQISNIGYMMNTKKLLKLLLKNQNGKIPVIAGTGSNSTSEAIELSQHAEKVDATF